MQWLYNFFHGIFTSIFAWYGKLYWFFRKAFLFNIAVITTVITVGVMLWRMFHWAITTVISTIADLPLALSEVTSISSVGDILDLANFLFPVEECLAMMMVLITYGAVCLQIRIIRSFIPMMT